MVGDKQKPLHILAKPEEISERVIIAGDPARVKQVAQILNDTKLVNENRGFLTYTGYYKGTRITVATHGIGGPSAAIVIEELIMLGAKVIVRLGTAGGMTSDLKIGDIVIPYGVAYLNDALLKMYVKEGYLPAVPHPEVLFTIIESANELGLDYKLGVIFSSNAFYAEDEAFIKEWLSKGIIAVEMECATLFTLGLLRRIKTGALLVISDILVGRTTKEMATAKELKDYVKRAAEVVLNTLIKVKIDD